jgi:hypothetical protein
MPGRAKDSGSDNAEAGNQGLEPEGQPETDQDQLAVHAKEGQEGVQVRGARPQGINASRNAKTPQQAHRQRSLGEVRSRTSTAKSKPCSGKLRRRNRHASSLTDCSDRNFIYAERCNRTFSGGQRPNALRSSLMAGQRARRLSIGANPPASSWPARAQPGVRRSRFRR